MVHWWVLVPYGPTKIGEKTSLGPSYFVLQNVILSYAVDAPLCRNWLFSPTLWITLVCSKASLIKIWIITTLATLPGGDSPRTCDFYKGFSEKKSPQIRHISRKKSWNCHFKTIGSCNTPVHIRVSIDFNF